MVLKGLVRGADGNFLTREDRQRERFMRKVSPRVQKKLIEILC